MLGSSTELAETPEEFFVEEEELRAFRWLKIYVRTHHRFPGVTPFRVHTGIAPIAMLEPISYYREKARVRVLYKEITNRYNDFKQSIADKQPDRNIAIAEQIAALKNRFSSHNSEQTFAEVLGRSRQRLRGSQGHGWLAWNTDRV